MGCTVLYNGVFEGLEGLLLVQMHGELQTTVGKARRRARHNFCAVDSYWTHFFFFQIDQIDPRKPSSLDFVAHVEGYTAEFHTSTDVFCLFYYYNFHTKIGD